MQHNKNKLTTYIEELIATVHITEATNPRAKSLVITKLEEAYLWASTLEVPKSPEMEAAEKEIVF